MGKKSSNPRYAVNYAARERQRNRLLREAAPNCPICGKPIDYSLRTWIDPKDGKRKPHPYSPEVDEIVPLALGGSPIDPDNLQIVHRLCNQKKGKKVGYRIRPPEPGQLPQSAAW